jgi:hypothetical protein
MKITRRQLRRIIAEAWPRDADGNLKPRQLSFNSKGADQAQELSEMIGTALNLFNKYSFDFTGVEDETINRIEGLMMDLVEELGTISVELEERGTG